MEEDKRKKRNQVTVSEKEIEEKLHELNLATLVTERQKRQEWFREHHIDLIQIETTFYCAPQGISRAELSQHMIYLNQALRSVRAELNWMRGHDLLVKMEKNEYGERYIYVGQKKRDEINQPEEEKLLTKNNQKSTEKSRIVNTEKKG